MSESTLAYFKGDYEELLFLLVFGEYLLSEHNYKTRDEFSTVIQEVVNEHKQTNEPSSKFIGEALWNLQLRKMQDFKSKKDKREYAPDYEIVHMASMCSKAMLPEYDDWIRKVLVPKMREYGFERCIPRSLKGY
jgi:hypothetical protein